MTIQHFQKLFPDGKNGLNDPEREIKISAKQNYNQKIFNKNRKFGEDPEFIFVAQQYLEIQSIENNLSVSVQKGRQITTPDGCKEIKSNNATDIFKSIPGTPAY